MEFALLAWKNLWRNRRRTLITLAAIAFSIMLMQAAHNLAMGIYASMVDHGVRAGSGHIAVYLEDYPRSRDESLAFAPGSLIDEIQDLPEVARALPRIYLPALAQSSRESRGILLTGVAPLAERTANPFLKHLLPGKMIRSSQSNDAVLGCRLLDELKITDGNKLVITLQNRQGDLVSELFRVRGSLKTGIRELDSSLIIVGLEKASAIAGMSGKIHELAVILESADDEQTALPAINRLLRDKAPRAVSWEEAMPNLADAIKLDYAGQKFIFLVITLIVTIGVVNTLLMSVMERIREFGVMLAIGASPAQLRRLILTEALMLALAGIAVGTLLGSLITWYLVHYGIDLSRMMPESMEFGGVVFDPILRATWDFTWMARICLYLTLLTVAAALYPAHKAARIAPAAAMRKH
ncbi:MAG: FtsX-like permease family protein [Desulfuromonadaceae bacterium]|nr:FtsX-like permease family protein [Desulfuromonadaceae bacterium]